MAEIGNTSPLGAPWPVRPTSDRRQPPKRKPKKEEDESNKDNNSDDDDKPRIDEYA